MTHEPLLVLLLGLLEKQASRLTFTVSVPSHFSFMHQSGRWRFCNLDIQTSQILRLYFRGIVFYLHLLKLRVFIIILLNHFYLL